MTLLAAAMAIRTRAEEEGVLASFTNTVAKALSRAKHGSCNLDKPKGKGVAVHQHQQEQGREDVGDDGRRTVAAVARRKGEAARAVR